MSKGSKKALTFLLGTSRISQNSLAFGLNILKLPSVNRPPKPPQNEENQHDRQRDEQVQDIHSVFKTLN